MKRSAGNPAHIATAIAACALITTALTCSTGGPASSPRAADANARWVTEKQGLRMRESPDQKGRVLAVIPCASKVEFVSEKGETMTISGASGKWTEVKWNEKKGWVFGGFLGSADPAASDRELIAAAERYSEEFSRKSWGDSPDRFKALKNYGARIREKSGNFAIVETGIWTEEDRVAKTCSLWARPAGRWQVVAGIESSRFGQNVKLLHLNNDDLIDAVVLYSSGDWSGFGFYIAKSSDTIEKADAIPSIMVPMPKDVSFGRCGKTRISGPVSMADSDKERITTFTFDCATNRLKKISR